MKRGHIAKVCRFARNSAHQGSAKWVEYGRPFVSKLVMTVLCKKWATSRDELLASRDS